jgi:agmatine deiminase
MIPDWETNCVYLSRLLAVRHPALCQQLTAILEEHGVPVRLLDGTADIWARDYCPVQVVKNRFVKFRYYPDYLRGRHEDRITTDDTVCGQLDNLGTICRSDVVLDGGNLVTATTRAILTDKVYGENSGWQRDALRCALREMLDLDECILIPKEPGDPFGHADGVVRFLSDDLVVMGDYSQVDPGYGDRLRAVLLRHHLQVEELPYFCERRSRNGIPSAVGNYVNFLRIGRLILAPAYGVPQDEQACQKLKELCPEATVVPLLCVDLAREGGVLNCISWTVKV